MGKQAFLEQLQHDAGESPSVRLEEDKQAWVRDLQQLMLRMQQWLADPRLADDLQVEHKDREIAEEEVAPYIVPSLTITFRTRHPRKVQVLPRAMQVVGGIVVGADGKERRLIGASGRVDLVCGPARQTLLRFVGADGTTWRWLRLDLHEELDEDGFFEALRQLIA